MYQQNIILIVFAAIAVGSTKKQENQNAAGDLASYMKLSDDLCHFVITKTWSGQDINYKGFKHNKIANHSYAETSKEAMTKINKRHCLLEILKEYGIFTSYTTNNDVQLKNYTKFNSSNVQYEGMVTTINRNSTVTELPYHALEDVDNAGWPIKKYPGKNNITTGLQEGERNPLELFENRNFIDHADPLSKYLLPYYNITDKQKDIRANFSRFLISAYDQILQKRY